MTSMELISQCLDEYNDKFYFCSNEDHIQRDMHLKNDTKIYKIELKVTHYI